MNPRTEGRMLRKDISESKKFASLSPEAAVLFCMIIPHLNSHGKMNGGIGYIKDEICPRVPYLTFETIPALLLEISAKTNMRWFEYDGRHYIHSVNFLKEHQKLKPEKLGQDLLPSYSGANQDEVPHEVEVKGEVEEKKKEKKEDPSPLDRSQQEINRVLEKHGAFFAKNLDLTEQEIELERLGMLSYYANPNHTLGADGFNSVKSWLQRYANTRKRAPMAVDLATVKQREIAELKAKGVQV